MCSSDLIVALWEKMLNLLPLKQKTMKYKEGIDYQFVDFNDSELTGIGLLIEDYKGVLYHYHKARVVEEGEIARLQFGYTIVNPGEHDIDTLTNDEKLHTIMGDILTDILLNEKQLNGQVRTNDSEESDSQ